MLSIINYMFLLLLIVFHNSILPQASSPEEALFEDKSRPGSMPPSCHNSCSGCHPCLATQVPTLPSHDKVLTRSPTRPSRVFHSSAPQLNQYSNYKPMGWKCRCNGHFYNP